jgi:SNF2 family DNA or RNA helicase
MTAKRFKPHPYQLDVIAHQCTLARGMTFAGMGTGKTVSTLTAIDNAQFAGTGPALVLAPKRVAVSTWPDEVQKWDHLSHMEVQPIVGDVAQRRKAMRNSNAAVFTLNYENLPWLVEELNGTWVYPFIVADESTRLKGFRSRQGAARPRALGRVAHGAEVARFVGLSGTPAPNGLADLWGQIWFVDAGKRLGRSYSAFSERWFTTDYTGYNLKALPHAQREIEEAIADVCLTVRGLPVDAPIVNVIPVDLPPKARQIYRDMEKTFYTMLSATTEIEAFNAAVKSQKLLQLASGNVYDDDGKAHHVHAAKLDALDSVIEESAGAPVLVAYNFRSDLQRLQDAYPKARTLDTNPGTIREWNAGKIPLLFAHPASAGHGLNLQDGGNILAFYSIDWNLEYHDQIIERIGPMRQKQAGHDRPVYLHYLIAKDTIEEVVLDRLRNKRDLQDVLMEAMRRRN